MNAHPSLTSVKITPQHLERKAVIYIRQSSPKQVREHVDSQLTQRALLERAHRIPWRSCASFLSPAPIRKSSPLSVAAAPPVVLSFDFCRPSPRSKSGAHLQAGITTADCRDRVVRANVRSTFNPAFGAPDHSDCSLLSVTAAQ